MLSALTQVNMRLTVGLSYIASSLLRCFHSIPNLLQVLIMKGCWTILSEMNIWFCTSFCSYVILELLICEYESPCLQDISYFMMVYKLSHVLLDAICQYFIENVCIYIHQRYCSIIFICLILI
jgi:hypothetical protein